MAPNLDKVDEGIKRRIIIIPFDITFVDNPTRDFEEKKIDFSIDEKEELKNSFLNLMINNYVKLSQ